MIARGHCGRALGSTRIRFGAVAGAMPLPFKSVPLLEKTRSVTSTSTTGLNANTMKPNASSQSTLSLACRMRSSRADALRSLFSEADENSDGFVDVYEFGRFVARKGYTFNGRDPTEVFGDYGEIRWFPLRFQEFERLILDVDAGALPDLDI